MKKFVVIALVVFVILFYIFIGRGNSISGALAVPVELASVQQASLYEDLQTDIVESEDTSDEEATPAPETSAAQQNTAVPNVTRENIAIEVLNGTAVAGLAGTTKTDIEKLGFTSVNAANSPNQVTSTTISYSKEIPTEFVTQLEGYLASKFGEIKSVSLETSTQGAKPQITIILGRPIN